MNGKIQVEKLDLGPRLTELEPEWEALLRNSSRPSVFSTFDYVYTSCKHFKAEEEVFFLFFRDSQTNKLLAIFPIGVWNDHMYGINLKVITHGVMPLTSEVDKPYPIIDKDHEPVCWQRFRDYFRKEFSAWDIIDYDEFMPESYLHHSLKTLFPFPSYWTKVSKGPDSPIVPLDGDWNDFWMGHRKLRKNTRKLEKKLGDNLHYVVTGDPADVKQCLNDYIATELISWKAGEFVSDPNNQEFYRELFPKMAAKNRLFFGVMYDQGKVMSVEVAYTFEDRVFFAHGTYDPAYADLSPGTVNSCRLIQFFHGKGFTEGDYLAGFSSYNNPWASRIDKTVNIMIRRMSGKHWYLAARYLVDKILRKLVRMPGKHSGSDQIPANPEPALEGR